MDYFKVYIAVCISVSLRLSSAQNILERCVEAKAINKSASLSCEAGKEIVHVNLVLGTETCNTPPGQRCTGHTASSLVDSFNCYWKRSCVIHWPNDRFIRPDDHCSSIVGSKPGFMQISYRCYENAMTATSFRTAGRAVVYNLCGEKEHDMTSGFRYNWTVKPLEGMSGIIRSHELYPWNYREFSRNCTLLVYYPTSSVDPSGQMLVVSVQELDLGEGDRLSISSILRREKVGQHFELDTKVYNENSQNRTFVFEEETKSHVNFTFSVGAESNGGKGFIVCFKFLNSEDPIPSDVCSDIATRGSIQGAEQQEQLSFPELKFWPVDRQPPGEANATKAPVLSSTELPKKCSKKITAAKRRRCAESHAKKMERKNGRKKNKKDRTKKEKRKKRNKNRRRRRRHNKKN